MTLICKACRLRWTAPLRPQTTAQDTGPYRHYLHRSIRVGISGTANSAPTAAAPCWPAWACLRA